MPKGDKAGTRGSVERSTPRTRARCELEDMGDEKDSEEPQMHVRLHLAYILPRATGIDGTTCTNRAAGAGDTPP